VTVTQLAARTEVRSLLDEPTAQFWSDTELNSWLYQATQDIARQAQALWMQVEIASVPEQQFYALPTDFLGVHRIDFQLDNADQTYNLEFRGIKAMDEIWGILHQLPAAFPTAFYMWNDTGLPGGQPYFATYPVPATTGTFIVYYYRNAIIPAGDTALLDVTPAYEDLAYSYAVAKARMKDRDPTWREQMGMYQDQLQMMFNKTSRFSDQGDQFTSGSGPNWPIYMYSDVNDGGW
jgi:hypothetical protein